MRLAKCWLLLLCIWLSGCSAEIDDYRATTPKFDLFNYFVGTTHAWGMVQDYTEKQTRRFEVVIEGRIENNQLILVEDFVFDDGEKDQRIWTINRTADDAYEDERMTLLERLAVKKWVMHCSGNTILC